MPFAGEVAWRNGVFGARHRAWDGRTTGWELRKGNKYFFSRDGFRALFRSDPTGRSRLVLSCGALPAIAFAALEGHRSDTVWGGVGGGWTQAAEAYLYMLVMRGAVRRVVLAFAANPAGNRSRAVVRDALASWGAALDSIEDVCPPGRDWVAALASARGAPLPTAA